MLNRYRKSKTISRRCNGRERNSTWARPGLMSDTFSNFTSLESSYLHSSQSLYTLQGLPPPGTSFFRLWLPTKVVNVQIRHINWAPTSQYKKSNSIDFQAYLTSSHRLILCLPCLDRSSIQIPSLYSFINKVRRRRKKVCKNKIAATQSQVKYGPTVSLRYSRIPSAPPMPDKGTTKESSKRPSF